MSCGSAVPQATTLCACAHRAAGSWWWPALPSVDDSDKVASRAPSSRSQSVRMQGGNIALERGSSPRPSGSVAERGAESGGGRVRGGTASVAAAPRATVDGGPAAGGPATRSTSRDGGWTGASGPGAASDGARAAGGPGGSRGPRTAAPAAARVGAAATRGTARTDSGVPVAAGDGAPVGGPVSTSIAELPPPAAGREATGGLPPVAPWVVAWAVGGVEAATPPRGGVGASAAGPRAAGATGVVGGTASAEPRAPGEAGVAMGASGGPGRPAGPRVTACGAPAAGRVRASRSVRLRLRGAPAGEGPPGAAVGAS